MTKSAFGLCILLLSLDAAGARGELWINPLFQKHTPAAAGPFVRLADGRLLVVEGNATRTSADEGLTWSAPRPMYEGDGPGIPQKGPMLKARDGAIVLVYLDSSTFHWEWDAEKGEPIDPRMDAWTIRSLDDGQTWVDRQMIFQGYCGALIDIIQTKSGQIVVPVQRYLPDPVRHGTRTYVSADDGASWWGSNVIDLGGVGAHDGAFEPTLVELKDGRLYMLMRTSWERFWEAFSWDQGLTWRKIGPSDIASGSSPGCLKRLASGRIALVWTSPLAGAQARPLAEVLGTPPPRKASEYFYIAPNPSLGGRQVSIMFSDDESQTWGEPIVVGRESIENAGLRYVQLFEPEPGQLWISSGGSHSSIEVRGREQDLIESLGKEAAVPQDATPLGFRCLGTALPDEVYAAPIPDGWLEKNIEEADPSLAGRINTRMPPLSPQDRQTGYVTFVKHWGDLVFPHTAPLADERTGQMSLFACPGEYEPASFSLRALRDLTGVRVTVGDLEGPEGSGIDRANVDVRVVRCLPTRLEGRQEYVVRPRVLERRPALDISTGTTQQFWLTVYVPPAATPGEYTAPVTVRAEKAPTTALTLKLDVLPLRLRPTPVRHFMYAYMYGDPLAKEIISKNLVNMREHGLTGGYFSTGLYPELTRADGRIDVSIEPLKDLLKECQELGLVDPFIYSPGPEVTRQEWGDEGYVEILRQIVEQLKTAGLPVAMLTFGDEDDEDPVRSANTAAHLRLIDQNLPDVVTYGTISWPANVDAFRPWLDVRAYNSYAGQATVDAMQERGEPFWMYSGASTYGMTPMVDRFYRGFFGRRTGAAALGEWVYQWPVILKPDKADPYRDFATFVSHGNNWDYCLPAPDGPLPTLGWEGFREGIDDGRYIATLEHAISQAANSEGGSARAAARQALDRLDAIVSQIDLSADGAPFPVHREAAKFTNSDLDGWRREIADWCLRLTEVENDTPATP